MKWVFAAFILFSAVVWSVPEILRAIDSLRNTGKDASLAYRLSMLESIIMPSVVIGAGFYFAHAIIAHT